MAKPLSESIANLEAVLAEAKSTGNTLRARLVSKMLVRLQGLKTSKANVPIAKKPKKK